MAPMSVEKDGPTVESVRATIRERGSRIREREQERAIRRLNAQTDLTEQEERAVRELARSLTDQLLAVPEDHLDRVADEETDPEAAAVTLALFGDE